MDEPSVLDYVKAKLTPWKGPAPAIPPLRESGDEVAVQAHQAEGWGAQDLVGPVADTLAPEEREAEYAPRPAVPLSLSTLRVFPWQSLGAVFLAVLGQRALEPPDRSIPLGVAFYLLAAAMLIWAYQRKEWSIPRIRAAVFHPTGLSIRIPAFLVSILFLAGAFLTFGENRFTSLNVTLWLLGLGALIVALWGPSKVETRWSQGIMEFFRRPSWQVRISPWMLALLAVTALAVFFRLYRLDQVPPEMFSDHAEKLTDVGEVLAGQYSIFFPRNTGREAVQMYLTAGVALLFNTGLSFMSLKIGTALAGLVTLPFIYLTGKEAGNRNVGLAALAFAAIAYWPNVISRVALRFTLYPLFVAPALYFLIRGLRTGQRKYYILTGIFLGLGLHGYSPFRFVPLVVIAFFLVYLLHRQSLGRRREALFGLIIVILVSFAVFLPLMRYAVDEPEMFLFRTLTRIGSSEQPLDSSPLLVFFSNTWAALTMFFWSNGGTWVHSIVHRPALDVISAALFGLGVLIVAMRYLRDRNWLDIALLVSIPLLLMPSILSLAFPAENPSLNRTAGAVVPVFVIVGLTVDGLMTTFIRKVHRPWGARLAWLGAIVLLLWSASLNYDLVFKQYFRQFQLGAWNTSEIGQVIRAYADSVGDRDSAWVVPSPHWVDTRLVGINAGFPEKDYALWPENLDQSLNVRAPKLFILRPDNQDALNLLYQYYPDGFLETHYSAVENKDFLVFYVAP